MIKNSMYEAFQFAQAVHKGQFRKFGNNIPFVTHPINVCRRLMEASSYIPTLKDECVFCAALLHDVLENTSITVDILNIVFSENIVRLVVELTNVKIPGLSRKEQKAKDRERLQCVSFNAKLIKIIDRIDNLNSLHHIDAIDFSSRYIQESKQLLYTIADSIGHWNAHDPSFEKLVSEFNTAIEDLIEFCKKHKPDFVVPSE